MTVLARRLLTAAMFAALSASLAAQAPTRVVVTLVRWPFT